jgi:hypothetical protein
VTNADEIVHDREKLERSGTHSLMAGLLAELIDLARERDAIAARPTWDWAASGPTSAEARACSAPAKLSA